MRIFRIFILFSLLLLNASNSACAFGIRCGFEALEIYNYFKAKQIFERNLKRNTAAAAYGLSVIYFRQDNPFHDIEKAYHLSLKSIELYPSLRLRLASRLEERFGINLNTLISHRAEIAKFNYRQAVQENTIAAMIEFKARHPWSAYKDSAENKQNTLAYDRAINADNSAGYELFLKHYCDTKFADEITQKLFDAQWKENIVTGDVATFDAFLANYPNHPNREKALDSIFYLFTKSNTIDDFELFIQKYPEHPRIDEAWLALYQLSISNYAAEQILAFQNRFPTFPFPERIENDLQLLQRQLLPFLSDGFYGFMDLEGHAVIPPTYDYASFFSNGLAAVMKNDKVGFINKSNELIIPFQFEDAQDFDQGRSIVELDDYFGVIDNTGHFIIPPNFDDIGGYHNDITFAYQNGEYQYYDWNGEVLFDQVFDEAFSFCKGLAKVVKGDTIGFIDTTGDFVFYSSDAQDVRIFQNGLFIVAMRDSMTIINENGEQALEFHVDRIGSLSENRAIIEKEGLYGYINELAEVTVPIEHKTFQNYFQFAQVQNGHVRFVRDGNFGLKDTLGETVFPAIFQGLGDFDELTPISRGSGWGYADKNAKLVIRYIYDYAYSFQNGLAIVQQNNKMGVINLKGEEVVPIEYDLIQNLIGKFFKVFDGQKFGIMDSTGVLKTDVIYDRYTPVSSQWLQLVTSDQLDYLDVTKGVVTTLQREDE